jgi:hypothetical protein
VIPGAVKLAYPLKVSILQIFLTGIPIASVLIIIIRDFIIPAKEIFTSTSFTLSFFIHFTHKMAFVLVYTQICSPYS